MIRIAVALMLSLAASLAIAQPCTFTSVASAQTDATHVSTVTTQVLGMSQADIDELDAAGKRVMNEASKRQDKGGPYTLEMTAKAECVGKRVRDMPGGMYPGVTAQGLAQINRAALKELNGINTTHEDKVLKDELKSNAKHGSKAKLWGG